MKKDIKNSIQMKTFLCVPSLPLEFYINGKRIQVLIDNKNVSFAIHIIKSKYCFPDGNLKTMFAKLTVFKYLAEGHFLSCVPLRLTQIHCHDFLQYV